MVKERTIEEQQALVEKIEGLIEKIRAFKEGETDSYLLTEEELDIMKCALAFLLRTDSGHC